MTADASRPATPRLSCACLLGGLLLVAATVRAAEPPIEAEIARIAAAAGGVTGVAAWRLDGTGPSVLVNPQQRFPMASTYKVAIAGAVLAEIDAGHLQLGQLIAVEPEDLVPYSDVIATRLAHPGVSLSIQNLLELMLTESDNTATDVLMRIVGGAGQVTRWVEGQGITDFQVDRNTATLLREFFGLPPGKLEEVYLAALEKDPGLESRGSLPNPAFDDDLRDTATPAAMGKLLARIFSGQALSAASTTILVEMMQRCRTGEARLPGRMPAGTVVAHKTGTLGGSVNDVGVVALPSEHGQLVIAVFIKKSDRPMEQRERAIADIARSVRDYFVLHVRG